MTCKRTFGGLGVVLLFLAAQIAHAQGSFTTYTDRATWEAAAGGGTGDIFDNFNSGNRTRTNFTITDNPPIAFPNNNAQTAIDGTSYYRSTLLQSTNFSTFTFNHAVLAVGYDLNPQPSDIGNAVNVSLDGFLAGSYNLPATDVNGFFGFVSDTPFTVLKIVKASTPNAWHGIDNFEAFSAAPVPEPTFMTLAVLGGVVAWTSRRCCSTTRARGTHY